MRFILILLAVHTIGYVFSQETIIQPVLQHQQAKSILNETIGITVHPGDSLYLEVTSAIPSQIDFFNTTSPVNITIVDDENTIVHEHYTGIIAFNKANIVRIYAQYFKSGRKLILDFEHKQGIKDIVLPIE